MKEREKEEEEKEEEEEEEKEEEAEEKEKEKGEEEKEKIYALWARTTKSANVSTGLLAHLIAYSLTLLLFACAALLVLFAQSFVGSLTHSPTHSRALKKRFWSMI